MQKITYINTLGESITFGAELPLILASVSGTGSADISRTTFQGALQDGKRTVSAMREDRTLGVTFHLITEDRWEMYRERAEMSRVLAIEKGFDRSTGARGKILYENDYGEWWTWALPGKMPEWPTRLKDLYANVKLSFDCDSPYWFGTHEKSADFQSAKRGFHFPFSFPIHFTVRGLERTLHNGGHAPAPVLMTVHGEGEKPVIRNETTGREIRFVEPVPVGTVLRIQTDPEELAVVLVGEAGEQNAYGYLDVTTPISGFYLAPGENFITYESDAPSSRTAVSLSWQERFEGV